MKDQTLAIHAGFKSDSATKSVAVPIYQTVAYEFDDAQHGADLFNLTVPGNIYTRIMNPTTAILEQRCAELEGGIAGLCLSAGSAAINYSILNIAEKGNNIVTVPLLYGGSYTLFKHMLPKLGIEVRFSSSTHSPSTWADTEIHSVGSLSMAESSPGQTTRKNFICSMNLKSLITVLFTPRHWVQQPILGGPERCHCAIRAPRLAL